MTYKIPPEECIDCGWCEPECDDHAISEKGRVFAIDADRCTECIVNEYDVPKCVLACLTRCPVPDLDNRETREELVKKWYRIHPGPPSPL